MPNLSPTPATPATAPPSFDARRQAAFCDALAQHGTVRLACNQAGVSPQTAYRARRASADLAACWDAALVLARSHAEAELADRALNGVEEPVFYRGEQVATRRRYDNRLLLAHLARLDRLAEQVGPRAAPCFDAALAALGEGRPVTGPGGALGPPAPPPQELPPVTRRLLAMEAARPADAPPMRSLGEWGKVEAAQLAAFEAGDPEWWLAAPGPRGPHAGQRAGHGAGQGAGHHPRHEPEPPPAPGPRPDAAQRAANGAAQGAGNGPGHRTAHEAAQGAGDESRQVARNGAGQGAGDESGQRAGQRAAHEAGPHTGTAPGQRAAPGAAHHAAQGTRAIAEAIARAATLPAQDRVPGVPGNPAGPRIAAITPDPLRRFRPPRPSR